MLPSDLRAADNDRQRVVQELQQHFSDGRLSPDELRDRVALAMRARTYGDLAKVQQDLPALSQPATQTAAPVAPAVTPTPPVMARRVRRRPVRNLRIHAMNYALIIGTLIAIYLLTTPHGYFWPIWPAMGWGIGLGAHAIAVINGHDNDNVLENNS